MQIKKTVSAGMKTFLYYNDGDFELAEFAKVWLNAKKKHQPMTGAKMVSGRNGFVGSGNWIYEFKDEKYEVVARANGRGFWGTDYCIYKS